MNTSETDFLGRAPLGDDLRKLAIRELRTVYATTPSPQALIASSHLVADLIVEMFDLAAEPRENLFTLAVNSRNFLIGVERTSRGGTDACSVSPRDILSTILVAGGVALIVVHNHPSGDPSPSGEDIGFTRRLAEAARTLGVELLDHIVVAVGPSGETRHVSMRGRGLV